MRPDKNKALAILKPESFLISRQHISIRNMPIRSPAPRAMGIERERSSMGEGELPVAEGNMEKNKEISEDVQHGITQNIQEILSKEKPSTMLSNSELIIMLNQSATDREKLAKFLSISEMEKVYITNVDIGEGLIRVRNSLVPFKNQFPKNTELYKLMTTKIEEQKYD